MRHLSLLLVLLVAFSACTSSIYVTPEALKSWRQNGIDVNRLQYYNDYSFSWQTKEKQNNTGIKQGVLENNGRAEYKKTLIYGETKCKLVEIGSIDNYLDLLFEEGGKPIRFYHSAKENRYMIQGKVKHGDDSYDLGSSTPVSIYVKTKDLQETSYKKHKMKGVTVK